MATRNKVRQTIVEILYSFDMGNIVNSVSLEEIFQEKKIQNEKKEFATDLIYGIINNLEDIDISINTYLQNWDFERIGYVERSIFRLGTYEIRYTKTNGVIVINETISIAKQYCNPKSINFINGVLNSIYQEQISNKETTI